MQADTSGPLRSWTKRDGGMFSWTTLPTCHICHSHLPKKKNVASVEKQSSIVLITFESLYDFIQWDSLWHSTSCISTLTSRTVACRCKFHAPWHLQFHLRATHWQLSISQSQHSQFVSGLHKTTCRSECSSVPCVKTLENQPEPDAESFASFHLALWTTQAMANDLGDGQPFNLPRWR